MQVHLATHGTRHSVPSVLLKRTALEAMRAIGCSRDAELDVALVSDATIARLNRRFLHHVGPTDVLTFPGRTGPDDLTIGEVVISMDRARTQAREAKWLVRREVALLLVHGVLHLGGFDDHTPRAALRMRALERTILGRIFRSER